MSEISFKNYCLLFAAGDELLFLFLVAFLAREAFRIFCCLRVLAAGSSSCFDNAMLNEQATTVN
jgi:hypothetical protein